MELYTRLAKNVLYFTLLLNQLILLKYLNFIGDPLHAHLYLQ